MFKFKKKYRIEYIVYPNGQGSKYWLSDGKYMYRPSFEKTNKITTILFLKGFKLNHGDKIKVSEELFNLCLK
jgi:hypothetical protein